jgi:serine phosphatase RsbU (regulator of sigma subunit)
MYSTRGKLSLNRGDKTLKKQVPNGRGAIIAQPYYDLSMKDGDIHFDEYLITKITSSIEEVGSDYVSIKNASPEGLYNIIIGDTIGHGINRSPGAIIAMAAFKASYSNSPMHILHAINRTLINIDKQSGGNTLCLSILLKKGGILEMAGKAESIKLISPKKKDGRSLTSRDIAVGGEILGASEKLLYTQKVTVNLNEGDLLMISTDGAHYNDDLDDKTIVMITRKKFPPEK